MIPDHKRRLSVVLDKEVIAEIDRLAAEHGVHRSTLLAAAVSMATPALDIASGTLVRAHAKGPRARPQMVLHLPREGLRRTAASLADREPQWWQEEDTYDAPGC